MKQHRKTVRHAKNEELMKGQRSFFNKNSTRLQGGSSVSLTSKDKFLRAEIIEALNLVDKNQSFLSSMDGNSFRKMFPDSAIAASYSQQETKTKYTVQFGIAPFVK